MGSSAFGSKIFSGELRCLVASATRQGEFSVGKEKVAWARGHPRVRRKRVDLGQRLKCS